MSAVISGTGKERVKQIRLGIGNEGIKTGKRERGRNFCI